MKPRLLLATVTLIGATFVGATFAGTALAQESASPGAPAGGTVMHLAFFTSSADNTYSQAQLQGATDVVNAARGTIQSFDGAFDPTVQTNAMQNALASGNFNSFLVLPNNGDALVPVVTDAIAKGIKVGAMFAPIGPDLTTLAPQVPGLTVTVGPSLAENGEGIAEMMVAACGDLNPCKAAYELGQSTAPSDVIRYQALQATIAQHPNIQLLTMGDGQFSADVAFKATQDLLTAHPDVNVIATAGDQSTQGAALAVQDAGLAGKVQLIGDGASEPGVKAVQNGDWYGTWVQLPYSEGQIAAQSILLALMGHTPPNAVKVTSYSPIGPLCTKDNCANFTAQWKG